MRLVRAIDSMPEGGQLRPNDLWLSWLHHVTPYFTALAPSRDEEGKARDDGTERRSRPPPAGGTTLLEKLYVTERREVLRYKHASSGVQLADRPESALARFLTRPYPSSPRLLLLTSRPGYGKTTFLHYFFDIWIPGVQSKLSRSEDPSVPEEQAALRGLSIRALFIDGSRVLVGPQSGIQASVASHIAEQLDRLLDWRTDELRRAIWQKELAGLENDLATIERGDGKAAREAYLVKELRDWERDLARWNTRRIRYLSQQPNCIVVLVLDNLDQVPKENVREALSCAQSLSSEAPQLTTICSVREYTHPPTRDQDRLGTLDFEVLSFGPPDLRSVIAKRLRFAAERVGKVRLEASLPIGKIVAHPSPEDMSRFFTWLRDALLSDEVLSLTDQASNHNVRFALKKVLTLMSSPYLDAGAALLETTNSERARPVVKTIDAWRALILVRSDSFRPFASYFLNIFDNGNPYYQLNNLVRLHILQRLQSRTAGQTISVVRLVADLETLGHDEEEVLKAAHGLILAGILETWDSPATDLVMDDVKDVAATSAAGFYRDVAAHKFDYLQWVSLATHLDEVYGVRGNTPPDNIVQRIWRATALIHHIARIEKSVPYGSADLVGLFAGPSFPAMAAAVEREATRALHAPTLERYASRPESIEYLKVLSEMSKGNVPDLRPTVST